jgi:hypothetical protein
MRLEELLAYMRVVDLKRIIEEFSLECSRSGIKEDIIESILKSDPMQIESVKKLVRKIAELYAMGGKCTLSLYKLSREGISEELDLFALISESFSSMVSEEISYQENKYKINKFVKFEYKGTIVNEIEFLHPSPTRQVFDYYEGPKDYVPTMICKCLIWVYDDYILLDIRASRTIAENLANCISLRLFGMDRSHLKVVPFKVRLGKDLAEKLHTRLDARNFNLKLTQDDEIDTEGILHPRSVEYITAKHDLKTERSKLKLLSNVEDAGHGLEFTVEYKGFLLMERCKIFLNFITNQVTFVKLTPIGVYEKVIDAILDEQP